VDQAIALRAQVAVLSVTPPTLDLHAVSDAWRQVRLAGHCRC
jgi:hypothetical protein